MELLEKLAIRYQNNPLDLSFDEIKEIIENNFEIMQALNIMEETGGEIELVKYHDTYLYVDMASESPKGRRGYCYDEEARISRKKFAPSDSVIEWCERNQVKLVDQELYQYLQGIKALDSKTSSWVVTPSSIRQLKGAVFMERRYQEIFYFHNGADSYYSSRGFRCYKIIKK